MNAVIANDLAKTILQKNSVRDCSLIELQQLRSKYSYSTAVQLLLTQKLKEENHTQYNEQLQKLSLYIQPPSWLEQLLEQRGYMIVHNTSKTTEPVEATPEKVEQPAPTTVETVLEEKQTSIEIREINAEPDEAPVQQVEQLNPSPIEAIVAENPSIEIPEIKTQPVVATTPELTFEPYHTVDYFASQGIRMRDEEIPKDKLGLQLKSFTEWLKTLKRLPATEISSAPVSGSEKKVEQMAELSLNNPEVVTEAMAEVWEKQGNAEKAIATYRKLSLLDPSKSSYFAAKIEHLKTT